MGALTSPAPAGNVARAALGGGLVGLVCAALDATLVGGRASAAAVGLLMGLDLVFGLLAGLGVGAAVRWLGIPSAHEGLHALRSFLFPPRALRPAYAARALLLPAAFLGLSLVLVVVNARFFAFNNPTLAALLLVLVTYALLALAVTVVRRLLPAVTRLAERLGARWPNQGDLPGFWLLPVLGLVSGALVAVLLRRGTAVAETLEALAPTAWLLLAAAPIAGYAVEPVLRRLSRGPVTAGVLVLSAVALVLLGRGVTASAITGAENAVLHAEALPGGLLLRVAERLTDRDGDGFSPLFGHGDCNDHDGKAWPGSLDGDDCAPAIAKDDEAELLRKLEGESEPAPPSVVSTAPGEPAPQPAQATPPSVKATPPAAAPPTLATPTRALPKASNILLITVDTVRADHVGFLGYGRDTTPRLDALAKHAMVYERAYAPSNLTPASIPSMLSGRYPTELTRDDAHFIHFAEDDTYLAEWLSTAGYETRAILTHWDFEKKTRAGLDQGFARWTVVGTKWGKQMEDVSTSEHVSAEALRQLAELAALPADRPWFLWLHFLDPHKWYVNHPGFDKTFGNKSIDRYDHELAFTDHHIGVVLDALAKHPAAARTVTVVTSDHGEAFGEHSTGFHGFSVYEDQLRVPLLIHVPALASTPRRIADRMSLIDLVPTLLDVAGVVPATKLHGKSRVPEWTGGTVPRRLIYAERPRGPYSSGLRALIDGDWKLCWRAAGNAYELYDLASDPSEQRDLFRERADIAERLVRHMTAMQRVGLDNRDKVRPSAK